MNEILYEQTIKLKKVNGQRNEWINKILEEGKSKQMKEWMNNWSSK